MKTRELKSYILYILIVWSNGQLFFPNKVLTQFWRQSTQILFLFFLLLFFSVQSAISQNIPEPTCGGSTIFTDHGEVDLNKGETKTLQIHGILYQCTGCGSCVPIDSQKHSTSPPTITTKQQLQMQMMQSILQPIFNSIFDFSSLFPTPQQSQEEAIRKQQEEAMRQQQEMLKKKAWEDWLKAQAEAEAKRKAEEAEKKKRGEEILAKVSISGGELKMESISGGTLSPIEWDTKKELSPISATGFPAPKTAVEQLLCAAYFSKLASESSDYEAARFYSTQMENVMQGLPTAIECKPPKELISGVDVKKAGELNKKYSEVSKIIQEITPKIEKLQDVMVKLDEAKKKKQESEEKIKEIEQKIEEIKAKAQTADTPQKKAEVDDLLSQALALKSDAEKQHQEAVQLEEKLNKEKENIENEINEIKNKMQKGEQR